MQWIRNDGGRLAAGFAGRPGDCVCRAIAIATGKPYREVYDALNEIAKGERTGKRKRSTSSARNGVYRTTFHKYLLSIGATWHPTMTIGSGCRVHMRADELPGGRLAVLISRHLVAVIDHVVYDRDEDPCRDGKRCVYGYYRIK